MNFKIHTTYKLKTATKTVFISDWIPDHQVLRVMEDLEKTGRFFNIEVEDDTGITWTKKEVQKLLTKIQDEPDELILYFDGSYQKGTNQAGLGIVLYFKQGKERVRHRFNSRIDQMDSNNEAEYAALYYSLKRIEDLKIKGKKIVIRGDSQGLLMQLKGEWPCYEDNLNRWLDKIEAKIEQLKLHPVYEPIPRNENKEADKLASQAIQGVEIESKQVGEFDDEGE